MKKRFQVFISSTFKDLEKEREVIANTLLEKDCIPVGMEWFSAMDEEKFEYIKKVIDDSDYCVLLLGGLYGSIAADGKSYTEKEFDYAVEQGKKVIVLVQQNPKEKESDESRLKKYLEFKSKVMDVRMSKFWNQPEELSGHLAISLDKHIKQFPAQGWIRCDPSSCDQKLPFIEMNSKIASLRLETVETIHIMASGTTSYLTAVRTLVKMNVEKKPIHIYIHFRIGSESERKNILKGATNNLRLSRNPVYASSISGVSGV